MERGPTFLLPNPRSNIEPFPSDSLLIRESQPGEPAITTPVSTIQE
jgi:hypothetical protein